ncbi:GNAT family protein [Nocardioides bigeumensis]|uniref:GNAT family protein n=1 Tax=Nocardioides bigeumensis TaxID=433657 RepID=A0ABP5KJJ8_9ACTN
MSDPQAASAFFETERLVVRPFRPADAAPFAAYRADPDVARYQSWSDYTIAEARALVASLEGEQPGTPGDWFQLAIEVRATGTLVGDLALHVDADEPRQAEIGFTLDPGHQGWGYATEALTAYLDWLFGSLQLHRVIAITDALNLSAQALLTRVGFRQEAHFVDNIFFKGAWGSEHLYARLDSEGANSCPHVPT